LKLRLHYTDNSARKIRSVDVKNPSEWQFCASGLFRQAYFSFMGEYGRSANGGRTLLARRSAAKDASHSAGGGPHGPLGTCRDLAHGGRRLSGMGDREPSPGGDADIAARQQLLPGHHRLQDSLVLVLKQPVVHQESQNTHTRQLA